MNMSKNKKGSKCAPQIPFVDRAWFSRDVRSEITGQTSVRLRLSVCKWKICFRLLTMTPPHSCSACTFAASLGCKFHILLDESLSASVLGAKVGMGHTENKIRKIHKIHRYSIYYCILQQLILCWNTIIYREFLCDSLVWRQWSRIGFEKQQMI